MARFNISLSHPQLDLAASTQFYSLEDLERKELQNIQLLLFELERSLVQNPIQHQGNNQFTPLDGLGFDFPTN
jgi:hypothetical protein